MYRQFGFLSSIFLGFIATTLLSCTSSDHGVYFSNISGKVLSAKVGEQVVLKFGVRGMTVQPAGEIVANTGHHHLIINNSAISEGQIVPKGETHIHFGKGETETTVTIEPHMKTLTLQFADGAHRSYGEDWSYTIRVEPKP